MSAREIVFVSKDRQSGAALVVSLILLMLLTVIAVSGFQSTMLQERMVGSLRDRQLAQQAAEAAIRYAEAQIKEAATVDDVTDAVNIATNAAMIRKINGSVVSEELYWNSPEAWTSGVQEYPATTLTGVLEQPEYKIERLPEEFSCVNGSKCIEQKLKELDPSYIVKHDAQLVTDFRITAKAKGAKEDGAEIILQSIYRRVD